MRSRESEVPGELDALHAAVLSAGERPAQLRALLTETMPDARLLQALLRRALPPKLLELLSTQPPFCDDPRILAGVVLNQRTPRPLAQRLLPGLYWRDLAEVAVSFRLVAVLRNRAELLLVERLPELRLGDRIALARLATPLVLRTLLLDAHERVSQAALANPRLREGDVVQLTLSDGAVVGMLRQLAASTRWRESYAVRLTLALQPRTPLGVALAQLTSLLPKDLDRIAENPQLAPLVRAGALRVARTLRNPSP